MTNHRTKSTLLYLRRNNEILLAMKKRSHGKGKWNGVGGKPEPGEALRDTAIRECYEEIGVRATALIKVADLAFYQEPFVDMYSNMDVEVYECTEWQGEPTESDEMAPCWFTTSDIPYDNMWPDDRYWLPEVLAGNYVAAEFVFDNQYKMIKHHLSTSPRTEPH